VTYQQPGLERDYHIFYWLLSGQVPQYAGKRRRWVDKAVKRVNDRNKFVGLSWNPHFTRTRTTAPA